VEGRYQIVQEPEPGVAPDLIDPSQMPFCDEVIAGLDDFLRLRCHKPDGSEGLPACHTVSSRAARSCS
jgi:hypothetical protein